MSVHPPSSSQIGHSEHSPKVLHEDDSAGAEVRSDGDIEASIAIEQSGVAPIKGNTLQNVEDNYLITCTYDVICTDLTYLSVDYKHWYLGAIFAGIEHLIGFEE